MKNRGFALTELLIAVAVLMVIFGLLARQAAESRRRSVINQIVAEYVTDFQLIGRASREFVNAAKSTWGAGTVNTITFTNLRSGGYLPSSFAARSTGDGTTPMGNSYSIVSIKDASGSGATTVVSESGSALAARLESAGLASDATGLAQMKRRIAAALVEQRVIAGTIDAGTTVVNGAGSNGWTKALAAYFGSAPTQPATAVLIGFKDLETDVSGGSPDDNVNHGECRPIDGQAGRTPNNMSGWVQPTCPGSHPVKVAEWPVCGGEGYQYDGDFVDIQASIQERLDMYAAMDNTCTWDVSHGRSPPCDSSLANYGTKQVYAIGNMAVVRNICSTHTYYDTSPPGNLGPWYPLSRQWTIGGKNLYCCQF